MNLGQFQRENTLIFFLLNLSDPNYYSYKIDHKNIYPIIVQRSKSENIRKTYIKGEVVFERK